MLGPQIVLSPPVGVGACASGAFLNVTVPVTDPIAAIADAV
jgi:hypothetical protein